MGRILDQVPKRTGKQIMLAVWLALLAISAVAQETQLRVASVTASSNDGNMPENTLDGNFASRWSAYGDGEWILFDLGSAKRITRVQIAWHQGNKRTARFEVQTSSDEVEWTTVFSGKSCVKTLNLIPVDVVDTTGRYVRVVGHGNTVNLWNSITEVRIFGMEDNPEPPSLETPLAVVSVWATSDDGNAPANTLDGSLNTRWSALGDGQCITFDVGAICRISTIDIAWYQGDTRIETFDIKISCDGALWTTVFSGASCGATVNLAPCVIPDTPGRYICVVGHGNTANQWNSITEVAIYGRCEDSLPPPTPLPPPTTAAVLPSDVLNLTNWKLTLPVNTAHAGNPDEIKQPELDGFQDPDVFHLNCTSNAVVFKAHCGGATTSGSGYPRSELREMANNGTTQASWSTTSGTHTLVITQAITHLPDVKKHVVAGQIHDASDDIIVFRLEDQKLFIDLNGDPGPVLTSQYRLGDVFTAAFVARNGSVECYYNGSHILTYPISASGCYFKAGCYTQSNTTKGDIATAYGEVIIYGLSVTHQ